MSSTEADRLAKVLWDFGRMNQKPEQADAIIVFGSYNPIVAERAADLFLQGYAPVVVFSGGRSRATANWEKTEAETFADIAVKKGVPGDSILLETNATNSGENTRFSRELLASRGIKPKKIIVVQKPYIERRTYATIKKQWPDVEVVMASPIITYQDYMATTLDRDRTINTIVGDIQRLKFYAEKGLQIPIEVPDEVWEAYERLLSMGYDKSLAK